MAELAELQPHSYSQRLWLDLENINENRGCKAVPILPLLIFNMETFKSPG